MTTTDAATVDAWVDQCTGCLQPGETVETIFPAIAGPPPYVHSWWVSGMSAYLPRERRIVVVTTRAIRILAADNKWQPGVVLAVLPRNLSLGPTTGTWCSLLGLGGGLYVHSSYRHRAVESDVTALAGHGPPAASG